MWTDREEALYSAREVFGSVLHHQILSVFRRCSVIELKAFRLAIPHSLCGCRFLLIIRTPSALAAGLAGLVANHPDLGRRQAAASPS